uniref:Galactose oxidase-like Early set domain-containing protein n=1 Tax=Mycena chlorophos TaxID=658473 RepID=A0ABQ0LFA5_MYCCL|nr:predicted protein [Mycena chlorophos]
MSPQKSPTMLSFRSTFRSRKSAGRTPRFKASAVFSFSVRLPDLPAVALMDLGYSSHSFHASARLVWLDATLKTNQKTLKLTTPPNNRIYPPGIAWIYVTVDGKYVSAGSRIMIGTGGSPPVEDQGRQISWLAL